MAKTVNAESVMQKRLYNSLKSNMGLVEVNRLIGDDKGVGVAFYASKAIDNLTTLNSVNKQIYDEFGVHML